MSSFTTLNLADTPRAWRDAYNNDLASIQTELTKVIHQDGSVAMAGTLSMGSYRITDLGAAVNPTDAVQYQQLLDEVDKYTSSNEIIVHPSFATVVGKRYSKLEQALSYLDGVTYTPDSNYKINLMLPDDDVTYSLTGAEFALYKQNTYLYSDVFYPINISLGSSVISGGGNANRGTLTKLVLIFDNVSIDAVKLQYLKMFNCIIILRESKDLELLGVVARNCVFILQTGSSINLVTEDSSIHNCEGTVDLTEASAVNEPNSIYKISDSLAGFFSYA